MAKTKKKITIPKYILIRDTREHEGYGWNFQDEDCAGTEVIKLDEGDYTIKGMEHIFAVERKRSFDEIAQNLGKHRKRFYREMARLDKIKYVWLIIEQDLKDISARWSTSSVSDNYLISNFISLEVMHNVHVKFLSPDKAEYYMKWLCKKMWQYFVEKRI